MSDKNDRHIGKSWISLEYFSKYLKGNLLGEKGKAVEKEMAESDFLAESMEGAKEMENTDNFDSVINELNESIDHRVGRKMKKLGKPVSRKLNTPLISMLAAAVVLIVAGIVFLPDLIRNQQEEKSIVENPAEPDFNEFEEVRPVTDSPITEGLLASDSIETDSLEKPDNNLAMTDRKDREREVIEEDDSEPDAIAYTETLPQDPEPKTMAPTGGQDKGMLTKSRDLDSSEARANTGTMSPVPDSPDIESETLDKKEDEPLSISPDLADAIGDIQNENYSRASRKLKRIIRSESGTTLERAKWELAGIYRIEGERDDERELLKELQNSDLFGAQAKKRLEELGN